MAEFSIACRSCTENNGVPVMALENDRAMVDANTPGVQNFPLGVRGAILLVRLQCPRCSKQSLFFPTVVHYDCEKCGHHKEEYVRGVVTTPAPNTGQGLRLSEGFTTKAENADLLRQLRQGSIGGYGL